MIYIHTMEYYLGVKKKEVLVHATWLNLEILLSVISQTQKFV